MSWWKSLFGARQVAMPIPETQKASPPQTDAGGEAGTAERPRPAAPVPPALPRDSGLPNAFSLPSTGGEKIFDPALRGYVHGFRQGDAPIVDPLARQRWSAARAEVMASMLRAIAASAWSQHLVLRGSATMPAWVGDAARRPGDLDWVVLPDTWASDSAEAESLLDGFIAAIAAHGVVAGEARIHVGRVAVDEIWTYERAQGKRLTFSWAVPGLPPGKLQCDFVFKEALWAPPIPLALPAPSGEAIPLQAAGPQQSLAWKIVWLLTDAYPQGKDLYDAVLLSRCASLSPEMAAQVLKALRNAWYTPDSFDKWVLNSSDWVLEQLGDVEWQDFRKEHPWVDADLEAWIAAFRKAVAPVDALIVALRA